MGSSDPSADRIRVESTPLQVAVARELFEAPIGDVFAVLDGARVPGLPRALHE